VLFRGGGLASGKKGTRHLRETNCRPCEKKERRRVMPHVEQLQLWQWVRVFEENRMGGSDVCVRRLRDEGREGNNQEGMNPSTPNGDEGKDGERATQNDEGSGPFQQKRKTEEDLLVPNIFLPGEN